MIVLQFYIIFLLLLFFLHMIVLPFFVVFLSAVITPEAGMALCQCEGQKLLIQNKSP